MAKLLIEINLHIEDEGISLEPLAMAQLLEQIGTGYSASTYSATVTNDQGEVIRESE